MLPKSRGATQPYVGCVSANSTTWMCLHTALQGGGSALSTIACVSAYCLTCSVLAQGTTPCACTLHYTLYVCTRLHSPCLHTAPQLVCLHSAPQPVFAHYPTWTVSALGTTPRVCTLHHTLCVCTLHHTCVSALGSTARTSLPIEALGAPRTELTSCALF